MKKLQVEFQNGTQPLERTVWQSLKWLNTELYYSAIPLLGTYLREMKMCPNKNLYTNVYSNIIHNNQQVETPQISIN